MKRSYNYRKITACILAVAMLAAFSATAFASPYIDTKTANTTWGTLTGEVWVWNDDTGYDISCTATINSTQNMANMHADFEVFNYLTGARFLNKYPADKANSKTVTAHNWYPKSYLNARITVYGCAEVQHTTSRAVYPQVSGV